MSNGEENNQPDTALSPAPEKSPAPVSFGQRLRTMARNVYLILAKDLTALWQQQVGDIEQRFNVRADTYEGAVDARFDERASTLARHQDERQDQYQQLLDARTDERLASVEQRLDQQFTSQARSLDEQFTSQAQSLDQRFDSQTQSLDEQFVKGALLIDGRFDSRAAAADVRLDERLAAIDRYIDQRFKALEQRTDERMEAHERLVDGKLHNNRQDIVDRTDLLLQVFEQRLDKQRREINRLRAPQINPPASSGSSSPDSQSSNSPLADSPTAAANASADSGRSLSAAVATEVNGAGAVPMIDEQSPQIQLLSFRKLASSSGIRPTQALPESGEQALYDRILDWKKVAHEGLDQFSPDERETVDYILSFISDPKEIAYTRQHLRRFVATLQRIPPAQKSNERLLELGSLTHLAPAIRKFCGYSEVCCADFWEADEKITHETMQQQNGPDQYTFELRNFNVESDHFPYPDAHFRVALCCELIEHLQRDPMHMLWECNRVLQPDGFLLLTTPNIASARAIEGLLVGCSPYLLSQYNLKTPVDQHNREYAPYEIGLALAAAGFTVVELDTEDVWLRSNPAILELLRKVDITTALRGDNIFALARKTSAPIERYPQELYIE